MINHKGLSFPLFSFSFPVSLSLFLCLLSFSSHELWLSIVRDYRSIAGLWPVEDLLLIFICIWNKPILSCRWAAEPCGPIVCIYNMQEPVCVALLWIYSMCHTLSVCVCVCPCSIFGSYRLTLLYSRPPEPPVIHQRPQGVFPIRIIVSRTSGSLSSRLNRTLRSGGGVTVGVLNMQTSVEPGSQGYREADIPVVGEQKETNPSYIIDSQIL